MIQVIYICLFSILFFTQDLCLAQSTTTQSPTTQTTTATTNKKLQKIDLRQLERELLKIDRKSDLTDKLGIKIIPQPTLPPTHKLIGRKNIAISPTETIKDASPGKCDPKPVCISNPLTNSIVAGNQLVFPACINIHRCEGCCAQNEQCVAIAFHDIKFKNVGVINITTANEIVLDESVITVQNHTDCECQCQWRNDADCRVINPNYVKDQFICGCVCPEAMPCDAFHEFDKQSCKCICNKEKYGKLEQMCKSKNMKWNEDSCKCELVRSHIKLESAVVV